MLNMQTGMPSTEWYPPIDEARAQRLQSGRFQIHLEVGSIQKPNLEVIRAQFEQFARSMMEPIVTQGLALEGKRLSASELIRQWERFFAEYGISFSKIIVPVADPMQQQALMSYGMKPEVTGGNGNGMTQIPNRANLISAAAGEKGQGASPV